MKFKNKKREIIILSGKLVIDTYYDRNYFEVVIFLLDEHRNKFLRSLRSFIELIFAWKRFQSFI